jgi:hypothetical protein
LVLLEIFERLQGLEVFGETGDFFEVGVFGDRWVFRRGRDTPGICSGPLLGPHA